ncbi:MAG: flagellar hook-length control protein FliK, partial [Solirubrobacterales bacterium]|nr:flagellar hook-length control protein FliK [Solirubrobacterales bacterium]
PAMATGLAQPAATPAAAPSPSPAAVPVPVGAQLAEHVERVADVVRMTSGPGVARARLELHPLHLGSVDVRLRSTAHGLVAAITVDRPETLQVVNRAGTELQQQLADRGLTVLRLDVTLSGAVLGATDSHADDAAGQAGAREDRRDRAATTGRGMPTGGPVADDHPPSTPGPSVVTLASGALVDVHA